MNNYLDTAREVCRRIPFFTPALIVNSLGNYRCKIDERVASERQIAFSILGIAALASYVFVPTFRQLTIKYIITTSVTSIVVSCFVTTGAVIIGIVALGVLGYKLDQMLTNRAATHLAIKQYLKKDIPSSEVLNWLVADIGRIQSLLKYENVDLSKTDFNGNNLLRLAAQSGNLEVFTLLFEHSSIKNKAAVFFECVDNLQDSNWGVESLKIAEYMVDTKQISAEMFTDEQQCIIQQEPLRGYLKWTDEHIKWLQKLSFLGFSIDAGGVKSIRHAMSKDIFSKALDHAAGRPTAVQNDIFAAMRFLQKNSNNIPLASLESNVWNENMLEVIAPCLVSTQNALRQAFTDDNVTIGRLLWDMTGSEETKKYCFIGKFLEKYNSRFIASLLKEGEISSTMYTKEEQNHILNQVCFFSEDKDKVFESLNKYVEFGFDIRAKNLIGKTVREILVDEIAYTTITGNVREAASLIQSLEAVDKILEKQNIATAVLLKHGQASGESNLSIFPDDVLNHIAQAMVDTH